MDRLIIHPRDPSTDFLKPIYADRNATVVRGGVNRADLKRLIGQHDQTVMLGHGNPYGLLGVGQFDRAYAVDRSLVSALTETDSVYVWCYASDFVERHSLSGFSTGMFISDKWEALGHGIRVFDWEVKESNDTFAQILGSFDTPAEMFVETNYEYGNLAEVNPVADYNNRRLRYYQRFAVAA